MDRQDEVNELRETIRVLTAGLKLDPSFQISAELRTHAREGRTIEAVKELRRIAPSLGLVTAKRMVDALGDEERQP